MDINLFNYTLPESLIAKFPPKVRGLTRLLEVNRTTGELRDKMYKDLIDIIPEGDVLVINNTKVNKQRVNMIAGDSTRKIQLLFLKRNQDGSWVTKVGRLRKLKNDRILKIDGEAYVQVVELGLELARVRIINISEEEFFDRFGVVPIPPYMKRDSQDEDFDRYNTEFAKEYGSVASPTASLNMTKDYLYALMAKGVKVCEIELRIGWGTFATVYEDDLTSHKIHKETIYVSQKSAESINEVKYSGGKVWALGTTVARTLESVSNEGGKVELIGEMDTEIFIYPGYQWKCVDRLITNFHVPKSTLLAMVSSFGGTKTIMNAYQHAVHNEYNFLSYGDSMVVIGEST